MSGPAQTAFPGAIYDGEGKNLDGATPNLRQEQMDACPHRSMVSVKDASATVRAWLLDDDASAKAIPPATMAEAVQLILSGKAMVVLAKQQAPEVDVREELLLALDLFMGPQEAGGHA